MCCSCSYSPAVTILCLPCPQPRAAPTNPAGSSLCADGMGTFCWDCPKGLCTGTKSRSKRGDLFNCYWFSSFPPSFWRTVSTSREKFHCAPCLAVPEQGALFIIQPGFSTAALPLPHSHSDWHFPGSLEDPGLCTGMSCKASSCALQQEFSFPFLSFNSLPAFSFQVFSSKLSSLEDNKTSCCRSL